MALKVNAEEHLSWVPTGEGDEVTTTTLTMDTPKQQTMSCQWYKKTMSINNLPGKMVES